MDKNECLNIMQQDNLWPWSDYFCLTLQPGQQGWGSDSPSHCLRKESNWVPFVSLKSERDPLQEKKWTSLRHRNNVDEILRYMESFTAVHDPQVCT